MASRAEALRRGVLRVLFERAALSPPPPLALCTPEESGMTLEKDNKSCCANSSKLGEGIPEILDMREF